MYRNPENQTLVLKYLVDRLFDFHHLEQAVAVKHTSVLLDVCFLL